MGPHRKTRHGARLRRQRASNVALCQRSCIHRRKVKRHLKMFPFLEAVSLQLRCGAGSKAQGQKDALSAPETWLRTEFLCPDLGPCCPALSLDLSTNARTSAAIVGRQ